MTASPFSLEGKVALVTGAASGIGLETARFLASLGARLVATDIDAQGLETASESIGPDVLALPHDVTSEEGWAAVLERVRAERGGLHVLVNNAGIMMAKPFAEAGIAILRRQLQVNVESVYLGMHTALPLLKDTAARDGGSVSVVNLASIYGKVAGEQYAAYSATKGAVRALTKAVAIELAREGVRVNAVLPGPVATNLSASWDPPRDADGKLIDPEVALAAWANLIPMGRLGTTTDIAALVGFLASDAAAFVTGAEFIADGGYTAA